MAQALDATLHAGCKAGSDDMCMKAKTAGLGDLQLGVVAGHVQHTTPKLQDSLTGIHRKTDQGTIVG